jgi:Fe-S cluster assembly protein SufD
VPPLDVDAHTRALQSLPAALEARAAAGWQAFEAFPMPNPRDENWRYVEPDFDLDGVALADAPGAPMSGDGVAAASIADFVGRAVSIDGHTVLAEGSEGISVTSLGSTPDPVLEGYEVKPPEDRLAALHDAFALDGVVVHAPRGVAGHRPVLVEVQASASGVLALPFLFIRADEQAELSVVIDQRSPAEASCLVIPRIEVVAGPAARVRVTVLQSWGAATVALATHRLSIGRDASVEVSEAGFGAAYSRVLLDAALVGSGADARINGAYFGEDDQTLDYRYFMRHEAPNTTSDMFLKGAVGDTAQSVFTGLIRIEPAGQKTNAHQTNRNLVLSDGAEAQSVPNLEILADDVRCGHGSAVGPLDEEQRYYLMSRGLSRPRADRVQVRGFFEEALQRFPVPEVVGPLSDLALATFERVTA